MVFLFLSTFVPVRIHGVVGHTKGNDFGGGFWDVVQGVVCFPSFRQHLFDRVPYRRFSKGQLLLLLLLLLPLLVLGATTGGSGKGRGVAFQSLVSFSLPLLPVSVEDGVFGPRRR